MSIEKIEAEALKLAPKARARLAGKLLESLDDLSEDESLQLWANEAVRRNSEIAEDSSTLRDSGEGFRDIRSNLK